MQEEQCVYLGQDTDRKYNKEAIHDCQLFGQCLKKGGDHTIPSCDSCSRTLQVTDPNFVRDWQDPLVMFDRFKHRTDSLRSLLAGRCAFLLCGGPSAKDLPLDLLDQRGCFTLAINNAAAHVVRPQAFLCTDPPSKFSHCIWLDPGVMKLIPIPKLYKSRGALRRKLADGHFVPLVNEYGQLMYTSDCPNVWGFLRRKWIQPDDTFFLNEAATAGSYDEGVERTGQPKTICTMLAGMRLLRYLGASKVFLLGADFYMDEGRPLCNNYSFPQERNADSCAKNNAQFVTVNSWLCQLQEAGVFKRFGIEFYNCNKMSGLRAFPYVPFASALDHSTHDIESIPSLGGWYGNK